ncbi:uncharacterized protein PHACADRAFT_212732 [Phanerochaete carnosa HHB-10118-sp]|uniref:ferric-chelate reductase (NADPH) n=1 Tax=Phanerochaete carnosa (strain HHB-10118-sp) TaxID=650164 RepID=K5VZV1_PHACS|nr:uncharacterized protein PHACADRAFT_212732 [Phanerochaete carnosa HHB-10118-sp]EKM52154.1 hypothetical protein PHACADRAFT_212732 [Phanerochaete carnosa HHB-10118-sp]
MAKIWLLHPVTFHSSRVPTGYDYSLMTPWQIKMLTMKWHDWYRADWSYGHTTVEFFCAGIGAMMVLYFLFLIRYRFNSRRKSSAPRQAGVLDRFTAAFRYFTSMQVRFKPLCYYAPPTASVLGVAGIFTFVMAFALAVRPYYWPNSQMGSSPPLATRCGWISIAIMPFMIAFSTKVNYVGMLTGVSHERLQVYHRWTALFMYITSLLHTFPFIRFNIHAGDMVHKYNTTPWYWSGIAALVPQTWLIFMSWGFIRNWHYEIFKKLHFCAATIFMVALFIHCDFRLTSWDYFWATMAIYTTTWFMQVFRTLYHSKFTGIPYTLEQLSDPSMVRLTIEAGPRFRWSSGQHVFLRFLSSKYLHPFSTHPFTISNDCNVQNGINNVEIVLRVRGGITKALQNMALDKPRGRVLLDGPYGGIPVSLRGYDRVCLLAGGSGATFTVSLLLDLARGFKTGSKCKDVTFVVAFRHPGTRLWLEPILAEAMQLAQEAGARLVISIHVTSEDADLESIGSNAPTIAPGTVIVKKVDGEASSNPSTPPPPPPITPTTYAGRPDLTAVVREVCASPLGGRVAFAACGPNPFVYDVRNAVAHCQLDIADGYSKCQEAFLHAEAYEYVLSALCTPPARTDFLRVHSW